MKPRIALFLALLALLPLTAVAAPKKAAPASAPASAGGQGVNVAAVVGGDAVSSYDVANRIKFIIATAHFSNTPDVIERIRPQVLRSLIDEKLQMQEAARNDITVSDDEVTKAIAAIEEQRGMPPGAIAHILEENHVPRDTFTSQIRAQLAFNRILNRKVRPRVHITDEEIDLAAKKIASTPPPKMPQEMQIAVISLPVEKPSHEKEVLRLVEKLVSQIHSGASFEEVSRQFSSATAGAGGTVQKFWVRPQQLDPAIARALVNAREGTVTEPVRTGEGYTVVKVYGVHEAAVETPQADTEVSIKEILLKLKADAGSKEAGVLLQIGEEVARHPGTCEEKTVAGIDNLKDVDIEVNFIHTMLSDLPPAIKIIADNLKKGDISTPFASDEGIRLYMLCDRKENAAAVPDRERIRGMLQQQRMELEAQKYMRNLRRDTFVEVR